jgi:RNA polymerase-interacting CarD/CdnL/TRCF family regulator
MYFEKERLTIKIPVNNAGIIGMRHLITKDQMD